MKKNNKDFHDWISNFFCGYLTAKRNYSDKTVKSYKDTFNLLREYFDSKLGIKFINMDFDNCNKENIYSFLLYLRDEKMVIHVTTTMAIPFSKEHTTKMEQSVQKCTMMQMKSLPV